MRGVAQLEQGREPYAKRKWVDAHRSMAAADQATPQGAEDLELLARRAYMLGRDDDYVSGLERAHRAYLESGESLRAMRCAWWIGHNFLFRGETGPARGWFARARRLLERERRDCVERGYVLIAALLEHVFGGDHEAARATGAEIAETGERFGDQDLVAMGLMEEGHALVRQARTEDGLRLVDETMVAVTTGELSPIVAGIVYCNTIAFCQGVYELGRAREWTAALTRWCEQQPDMVAHNADDKRRRNLPVALAGGDQPQHLEFTRRQSMIIGWGGPAGEGVDPAEGGRCSELCEDAAGRPPAQTRPCPRLPASGRSTQ